MGQRWTLLIVRELLLGAKRFSDLKPPLPGISSSVLADRLSQLETQGIVTQRKLGPPTPAQLYELTEAGLALAPVLIELARWGTRFMGAPEPDDHFEPAWVRLGLVTFARRGASPAVSFGLHWGEGEDEVVAEVSGGRKGTVVRAELGSPDVTIRAASHLTVMALASGVLDPQEAVRKGEIQVEGDLESLALFPALFEMNREPGAEAGLLGIPKQKGS